MTRAAPIGAARTSLSDPLRIDGVAAGPTPGIIGLTICPGKHDPAAMTGPWARDLVDDLAAIRHWGAKALVTLIEDHEFDLLKVPDLGRRAGEAGLAWHHLPIRDVDVPGEAFESGWWTAGPALLAWLRQGERIVVHCRGGLGRSGLVAAKMLRLVGEREQRELAVRYQLITEHTNCVLVHERADAEKAAGLPEFASVKQMLARGWGGVAMGDITCMRVREHADSVAYDMAAPDALTRYEEVRELRASMSCDRKVPPSGQERSPREFLAELSRGGGWLALLAERIPATIEDLEAAGVPEEILAELRNLVSLGFPPKAIVGAFLAALSALAVECGCSRQFARRLRSRHPKGTHGELLEQHLARIVARMTAEEWA